MIITIIAVGKIKNKAIIEEIKNYLKQIPVQVKIVEIKDEPTFLELKKESAAIREKIPANSFLVVLDINGKKYDSFLFAKKLKLWFEEKRNVVFVIGGSYGVEKTILLKANETLSLSGFTFPHQIVRLLLVEQIYRAFKINQNHPYHK